MPVTTKKKTAGVSPDVSVQEEGYVYYEKSLTKNLGDYNSAKVTIGVTLPINPTKDTLAKIESTFEIADKMITKELEIQISDVIDDHKVD